MGFKMWPGGLEGSCGYCGAEASAVCEVGGEGLYWLTCPECYRDGCDECMPLGRGCLCPDCEDDRHVEAD